ncbi:MAG: hypothetical protein NTW28_28830, partial [Candidatus Solibacter sp.]|nr:hypothetical protein [Candidatus Solibacter sp.]
MRTVGRDNCSTCAISRLLTPFALSSRIAVRWAWLSICRSLLLSDSFHHPRQFPPRVFDLPLCLLLLQTSHLRQSGGEPAAGATQDGHRHLQIDRRRLDGRGLPLRFQKWSWLGENALASHARTFPPRRVELSGLPRVAMMRHERGGHPRAIIGVDPSHGHQILHCHLPPELALAH